LAGKEPWPPAEATRVIREVARHEKFKITLAKHARDRMFERDLQMGDLLYVLKNGFVYEHPEEATQPGLWKYSIETGAPNSGNRVVRLIVVPDAARVWAKVITIMWADE
jgi:hypothetical protein